MTPRSSYVWSPANAGFLRSRRCAGGGGGLERAMTGFSRDTAGPARWKSRKGDAEGTPGQGEAKASLHTPPSRPAPSAPSVCRAASPSVSLPGGGPLLPGLRAAQPWAARHSTHWVAGGRGRRTCSPAALGRVAPWPAGLGRAIPEKVCRAGLGEQRPGGGPGIFVDLFVTQSLLHGVSKAELQALPGRERTWGRGGSGAFLSGRARSALPPAPGSRSVISLEPWIRATHQQLPRNRRDLRPPPPALGLAMSGRSAAT